MAHIPTQEPMTGRLGIGLSIRLRVLLVGIVGGANRKTPWHRLVLARVIYSK